MARNGSGVYSLPANTAAVSGDPVSSTKFNSLVQDLEADANVDRPIAAGGTGASTAQAALTNLFSGATPGGADKIGGWDESAAAFAFFSLGSGLSFSGTTIGLDADLVTLAGLTPTADNFIVGNAGGTAWEVKTPSQARTTLGLGTAAVVNTGTSGATIPLLNAANTWSGAQTFGNSGIVLNGDGGTNRQFLIQSGFVNRWVYGVEGSAEAGSNAGTNYIIARFSDAGSFLDIPLTITRSTGAALFSTTPSVAGSAIWHAGNDGAGSGLDADTVDGVQGSAFATLAGAQTFTGVKTFNHTGQNSFLGQDHSLPATTGTTQTGSPLRVGAGNTTLVLDFGIANTGALVGAWLQVAVSSDLGDEYALSLNPNGGAVRANGDNVARVTTGTAANSGLISWGTAAPGTLAEGEIYLRHA